MLETLFLATGILAVCVAGGVFIQCLLNTILWALNLIIDLKEARK